MSHPYRTAKSNKAVLFKYLFFLKGKVILLLMGNNIKRQMSGIFWINFDRFYSHRKLRQKKV